MKNINYSFNVEDACKYGVNESIILYNIRFWLIKNKANKTHLHENRYWTYNSTKAMLELFPFLTQRQVEYALNKLVNNGILLKGNFNENQYDRTLWYSVNEDEFVECILQNCEMENTKLLNGNDKIVKSYIYTDNKQHIKNIDNKPYNKKETILSEKEILFENFYKLYNNKVEITEKILQTKGYNKLKERFLKEVNIAKEEDILQGTTDYLSFIAFEHKRGFNRPLKDIQTFINQSAWEGDKGIPWNEIIQNNLNTTKISFINKMNAPNAYDIKKQLKEIARHDIDDDLPF